MPKITVVHHKGNKANEELRKECSLLDIKRVAAYCRVSTLEEEQDESYEAQRRYYRTMFENNNKYFLIGVYGDEGISGRLASKRPGFQDLLRDCRHGRIDEIYTKSISRFARNYSECIECIRELRRNGIVVYFEKENFSSDDPNIEMLMSIMAIIAQEESNSISQNITLAHEYRNKKGDPIRKAAYGYVRDHMVTEGIHRWHIKEDEALRVKMAYSLFLEGYSLKEVSERISKFEIVNGVTRRWNKQTVINTLIHEAYVGDLITQKSYTADYLNNIRKKNNGEKAQHYLKDHHPAIISREDFEKTHKILGRSLPECMLQ